MKPSHSRILLLGKNGQLGWEFQRTLATLGEVVALDYPEIDLAEPESLRPQIRAAFGVSHSFNILVNATAYTAVDRAESQPALATAINAQAPAIMAEEAARAGALLLHFSTDYVFDGQKGSAYGEADTPHPLNTYGASKLAGERAIQEVAEALSSACLVFRTSWVYSLQRESFVSKVMQWSRTQKTLHLVTDQISAPTWARLLAEISTQVLVMAFSQPDPSAWLQERSGLYHLAGSGWASRKEWGEEILKLHPQRGEIITEQILPALTSAFPTPAQRPLFSALDCTRFAQVFGLQLPPWKTGLFLAMSGAGVMAPNTSTQSTKGSSPA